jgi:hypothetical protein
LARTVEETLGTRTLRMADFTRHEAAMHSLQLRHKDRAWRNMVHLHDGKEESYAAGIARVQRTQTHTRAEAIRHLSDRMTDFAHRLEGRVKAMPDVGGLIARLDHLSAETLAVFSELGPWETFLSGGPEIDLDAFVPSPEVDQKIAA